MSFSFISFILILFLSGSHKRSNEQNIELHVVSYEELKDLEINGLIQRTVYNSLPLKVTYKLADYGYTLVPLIIELTNWGKQHREKIKTATL